MTRAYPNVVRAAAAIAIVISVIGIYRVGQSISLRISYESTYAELSSVPREVAYGGAPLKRHERSYLVSYVFQVDSRQYSGHGETRDQPKDGKILIHYLRSDPQINTPEHQDHFLIGGAFWLIGSLGIGAW